MTAILVTLGLGAALGLLLGVADKAFEVKVDPRIAEVTKLLPGYNCGSCGYPGCAGMANAIVSGEVDTTMHCRPSKPEGRAKIIKYLSETPGPDGKTITLKD